MKTLNQGVTDERNAQRYLIGVTNAGTIIENINMHNSEDFSLTLEMARERLK